jgi:hypothetical protein
MAEPQHGDYNGRPNRNDESDERSSSNDDRSWRGQERPSRWSNEGGGYGSGWRGQGYGQGSPGFGQASQGSGPGYRMGSRSFGPDPDWESEGGSGWSGRQGGSSDWGYSGRGQQRQSFAGRGPKNYQRSDERIREEICDRFTDDDQLDAGEVSIQVQSGEVTLTGTVSDREQKRRAEDLAESVSGVKDVTNQLRVERQQADQSA